MGDDLGSLPEGATDISPQEKEVISSLFGSGPAGGAMHSAGGMNWKLIGGATMLFVVLANPWIDAMLCKIPKCGNPMIVFGIKAVLFVVVMMIMSYFL